jgi:hypothetical protein
MDFNISAEKTKIQREIASLYGDVILTKQREVGELSLYYARVGCMMCVDDRYVIAVVAGDHNPLKTQRRLSGLNWVSFQTRTIEGDIGLQTRDIPAVKPIGVLASPIRAVSEKKDRKVYVCDSVPLLQIELLYAEEGDGYSDSGTVHSALETYSCVLSFTI